MGYEYFNTACKVRGLYNPSSIRIRIRISSNRVLTGNCKQSCNEQKVTILFHLTQDIISDIISTAFSTSYLLVLIRNVVISGGVAKIS